MPAFGMISDLIGEVVCVDAAAVFTPLDIPHDCAAAPRFSLAGGVRVSHMPMSQTPARRPSHGDVVQLRLGGERG